MTFIAAGCNDTAVVVRVESDRRAGAPGDLDALCLELAADGAARFGRRYDLVARPLPQTLTALSGGRSSVELTAYGLKHEQEVVRARRRFTFRDGTIQRLDLSLNACVPAPSSGRFHTVGTAAGAADRAQLLPAPSGALAISVSAGGAARLAGSANGLDPLAAGVPSPPTGAVHQLLAADLDADCRADLVVLAAGAPPAVWIHGADGSFTAATPLPLTTPLSGAAAGDVDGDGNIDLVLVGGGEAHVLTSDGAGHFRESGAFDLPPSDATAVALGDLDGDGHLDAVVAQGGAAPAETRVYLNDAKGTGHFSFSPGSLPPRKERATAVALADFDGDGHLDVALAHLGAPVRLYLNRGNAFLEDRSFVALPDQLAADVPTLLAVDLNGDCLPDLLVPRAGAAPLLWLNAGGGKLVSAPSPEAPGAVSGALAEDVDGDGVLDLLLFSSGGLTLDLQQ